MQFRAESYGQMPQKENATFSCNMKWMNRNNYSESKAGLIILLRAKV